MRLLERFIKSIDAQALIQKGDRVLVAVSGGADSVALLRLLLMVQSHYGVQLAVFHLNHQLRGQEADADQAFVQALCDAYDLPCHSYSENIEAYAAQTGQSFETAARERRYALLQHLVTQQNYHKVALAHHQNDQVETFFLRLLRGSGPDGLIGMTWRRSPNIIRPLLGISRREIEDYLQDLSQPFQTDATNTDIHYERNRIRHELIPYLEAQFNPNITEGIEQLMGLLAQDQACLDDLTLTWLHTHGRREGEAWQLPLKAFEMAPTALKGRIIRALFRTLNGVSQDLTFRHVEEILRIAEMRRHGAFKTFQNIRFEIRWQQLIIEIEKGARQQANYRYSLEEPGTVILKEAGMTLTVSYTKRSDAAVPLGQTRIYLSSDAVHWPLIIRNRQAGDKIRLKGMDGHKAVRTLFSEQKRTTDERDVCPIIEDQNGLVFVYDRHLAEDYYIDAQTECVLCLEFKTL